ncbi:MAG: carboxypeptidase-like regulatory domain-containing protein, partial [Melioribacteraceae bacterium]|nr:carboxypeptidase-like regulatory domain-containing protein [Melioribacteraceae bacterium]
MKYFLNLILILNVSLSAQQFQIKGIVSDNKSGEVLRFANILVLGEATGTTSNVEGNYQIYLPKGKHSLIFSFIGYVSDTLSINLTDHIAYNAKLKPVSLELPEVTVLPGENPALEIIRRAIDYKNVRLSKLDSYVFKAYTKGLV